MKKLFSVMLLSVFLLMTFIPSAYAYENYLVDDSANLFDDFQKEEILSSLQNFAIDTSFSAAAVTTYDSEGKTSQSYADDYYDNLVVSDGWSQDGILFLIDMDNREVCISTMGECISVFAYSVDYIIDSGYDELVNGDYSDCIIQMIDTAKSCVITDDDSGEEYYPDEYVLGDYYGYSDGFYDGENIYSETVSKTNRIDLGNIAVCIVISVVIAAITVFAVKSQYKNTGKGDEFDSDDVVLNLTGSNDTVISRNVVTTRVPKNNNSNHRHGGGGGVSHRSSGGFSHGGGSRKF
ncbi:MAG: TPM domain-containing protein [Lachnospiraceae bacterium]|nr:TPM domain-containing protein [Lachnospiraceae bacterium]